MLILFAVLAVASAALLLFRFSKRSSTELFNMDPVKPPAGARPLFQPSEGELRDIRQRERARAIAKREYRAKAESRAVVDAALNDFRAEKNAKTAGELLRVTAEKGLDGDLSRAAKEITESFHSGEIDSLSAADLAALLDSHIRLLGDAERNSGAMFWLKQEVARLRDGR